MLTFELSYQIKKYGIYDKDFLENFYSISIHHIFIAKMKSQRERNRKEMQEMQTFSLKLIQVSFLLHMF